MGIKVPYSYKVYQNGPKATSVDKFLHNPSASFFCSLFLTFLLIAVGGVIYNINRDFALLTTLGGILMFMGLIMLFAGPFLLPRLADKLHISDRVYEKETGIKLY